MNPTQTETSNLPERSLTTRTRAPGTVSLAMCRHEFLGHIGHELRGPISIMLAQAEALRLGVFGPISRPQREGLQVIEEHADRLADLIGDVVELSRLSADDITLTVQDCQLDAICARAVCFVQEFAAHHSVGIKVEAPEGIVLIADATRFRQMFSELLLAAITATPNGGQCQINVLVDFENRGLLLQLPHNSEQILSRLILTEKIVELQSGEITKIQLPAGEIQISVCLPNCLKCTQPGTPPLGASAPGRSATMEAEAPLILVAEDQKDMRDLLCHFLASQNYRVCIATTGDAAVEQAHALLPDLIILNMQMPIMDGSQVIQRLRSSQPEVSELPIIGLSGISGPGGTDRCLALGASAHLSRPFRITELGSLVLRLLQESQNPTE